MRNIEDKLRILLEDINDMSIDDQIKFLIKFLKEEEAKLDASYFLKTFEVMHVRARACDLYNDLSTEDIKKLDSNPQKMQAYSYIEATVGMLKAKGLVNFNLILDDKNDN
jgi:hypothetical protein